MRRCSGEPPADEFLGEADRVLLLSDGRAAFEGAASELIASPEAFDEAGLVAPEVLRAQQLAVGRGASLPGFQARSGARGALLLGARLRKPDGGLPDGSSDSRGPVRGGRLGGASGRSGVKLGLAFAYTILLSPRAGGRGCSRRRSS